ncbi:MAG: quinone-dependent dihydroorotate dehydrogenase [Deltaproteobacteria bacterium]|nr:quinone-dependent dihydroorotate dehydrogenase [Deltaproteobacteria bacterium]
MIYDLIRPLLFRLDPEDAHRLVLQGLRALGALPPIAALVRGLMTPRATPVEVAGLRFPSPLGLAAGWDKDGLAIDGLHALGFGHVEVGTVTPRPQSGNPRPRVFRLVEDEALINRMGFPSRGEDHLADRLLARRARRAHGPVVGVNLGKNKATPNELAAADYVRLVTRFESLADYLVVNVSSPNTQGLRDLQERRALEELLAAVVAARGPARTPLFVKLAPDLDEPALDRAIEAAVRARIDGIVATNTTLARDGLRSASAVEAGGLSGAPLSARATAMVRAIARKTSLPIIASGGVMQPDDVVARLDAGASLVQVWTGFVYRGPGVVRHLLGRPSSYRSSSSSAARDGRARPVSNAPA